jgi:hypothetical protein
MTKKTTSSSTNKHLVLVVSTVDEEVPHSCPIQPSFPLNGTLWTDHHRSFEMKLFQSDPDHRTTPSVTSKPISSSQQVVGLAIGSSSVLSLSSRQQARISQTSPAERDPGAPNNIWPLKRQRINILDESINNILDERINDTINSNNPIWATTTPHKYMCSHEPIIKITTYIFFDTPQGTVLVPELF